MRENIPWYERVFRVVDRIHALIDRHKMLTITYIMVVWSFWGEWGFRTVVIAFVGVGAIYLALHFLIDFLIALKWGTLYRRGDIAVWIPGYHPLKARKIIDVAERVSPEKREEEFALLRQRLRVDIYERGDDRTTT